MSRSWMKILISLVVGMLVFWGLEAASSIYMIGNMGNCMSGASGCVTNPALSLWSTILGLGSIGFIIGVLVLAAIIYIVVSVIDHVNSKKNINKPSN